MCRLLPAKNVDVLLSLCLLMVATIATRRKEGNAWRKVSVKNTRHLKRQGQGCKGGVRIIMISFNNNGCVTPPTTIDNHCVDNAKGHNPRP